MGKSAFLKRVLMGGACALVLAGTAMAQARSFDVPAGDLKAGLDAFSRQAGVQLVYRIEDVRGLRTVGVRANAEPEEVLSRLLAGTRLSVRRDSSGALAIVREAAFPESEAASVEEVVVTGSRLKNVFDAATPVVSMDRTELLEQGYMDLAEALTDIPGVEEAVSLSNSQTATQANGLSTISLRNLGENRTLTLIDGHRTVAELIDASGHGDIGTVVDLADLVEAGCATPMSGSMGALEQRLAMLAAMEHPDKPVGKATPTLSVIPGGAQPEPEVEPEQTEDLLSTLLKGVRGV